MKALIPLLLLLLTAAHAAAQTATGAGVAPGAPGVTVTQHKWRQEVVNPGLTDDPMRANDEQRDWLRAQKQTSRQNAIRERAAQGPLPPPSRAIGINQPSNPEDGERSAALTTSRARDARASVEYVYEAKVSNSGAKAIKALVWEYVLFDPQTRREVGKHSFTSKVTVRPGKSGRLVGRSTSPPAQVVDIQKADRQARGQYAESVNILRIEYADGTAWQGAANN